MKKRLLDWIRLLYFVIFSIVLYRAGSFIGSITYSYKAISRFVTPVILFLFLFAVSLWLVRKPRPAKYYLTAGIAALVASAVYWGRLILSHYNGWWYAEKTVDYIIQPAIVFALSVLIAAGYFKCAAIARKEQKDAPPCQKSEKVNRGSIWSKQNLLNLNLGLLLIFHSIIFSMTGSTLLTIRFLYFHWALLSLMPAILFLFLLLMGIRCARKPRSSKSYCATGIATLIVSSIFWGYMLYTHRILDPTPNPTLYITVPAIVFALSVLIAAGYFKYAAIVRKGQDETPEQIHDGRSKTEKRLLNGIFGLTFAIYSAFLLRSGFAWISSTDEFFYWLIRLLTPAVFFLILLLISEWLIRKPRPKTFYPVAGVATLIASGIYWVYMIYAHWVDWWYAKALASYIIFPAITFVLSGLIAAGYFKCAKLARKEQAETAELPKNE